MANNIVNLRRVFAAPVEKVFKAFVNADAMASCLPPLKCRLPIFLQAIVLRLEANIKK